MKLIIVTRQIDGEKMYVNPEQICAIYPYYKKKINGYTVCRNRGKFLGCERKPRVYCEYDYRQKLDSM